MDKALVAHFKDANQAGDIIMRHLPGVVNSTDAMTKPLRLL